MGGTYALAFEPMKSQTKSAENGNSNLTVRCIFGFFLVILAVKDLLAWAEFTSVESGWLMRVTGAEWAQPFGGLAMAVFGIILSGPGLMRCFGVRDSFRRSARRLAIVAAFICAAALVYTLDVTVPSKEILFFQRGKYLSTEARQAGLGGLLAAVAAFAGFVFLRRRDVGFWKVALPIRRDNDIWSMSMKAEIALRAVAKNDEAYRLLEERAEYIQS